MAMGVELDFPFIVGDEVELKSYTLGFRGAWFRCKIKKIRNRRGTLQCAMKYADYPDEKVLWTSAYEAAPKDPLSGQESKPRTKELMFRPPFPPYYKESEHSPSLAEPPTAEVTAVVNDSWRLGDLVDLWCDGCFWSGTIIKLQADNVEVELPGPPVGEGGVYKGVVRDLRPSLSWSQENGWSVPQSQANGDSWCTARLIQCSPLAFGHHHDLDQSAGHVDHALGQSTVLCIEGGTGSPVNLNAASKMALEWKEASCSAKKHGRSSNLEDTSNSKPNVVLFFKKKSTNEKGRVVISSDEEIEREDLPDNAKISDRASMEKSTDSLRFGKNRTSQKSKRVVEGVGNVVRNSDKRDGNGNREREGDELGIDMREAIMELEEAACKIRWLKDVLRFGLDLPTSRWKFIPNKDQ